MLEAAGKASAGVITVRVLWLLTTIKAPRGKIKERKGWSFVRGMDGGMAPSGGTVNVYRALSHEKCSLGNSS